MKEKIYNFVLGELDKNVIDIFAKLETENDIFCFDEIETDNKKEELAKQITSVVMESIARKNK